jgi:hypothetical protein
LLQPALATGQFVTRVLPAAVTTSLLLLLLLGALLQEEGGAARPGGLTELSWSVGIRRVEVLEPLLDMFYNKT